MALYLEGYETRVAEAVKSFWKVRETDGVRSGQLFRESSRAAIDDGAYSNVSRDTSIKAFLASLASHVETIAAIIAV